MRADDSYAHGSESCEHDEDAGLAQDNTEAGWVPVDWGLSYPADCLVPNKPQLTAVLSLMESLANIW